jgi:hypothetical protein
MFKKLLLIKLKLAPLTEIWVQPSTEEELDPLA